MDIESTLNSIAGWTENGNFDSFPIQDEPERVGMLEIENQHARSRKFER
jgi:hypothetical protein